MQTEFYKRYIRSDAWREKCEQRKEIAGHKCELCDRPESSCRNGLSCHHIHYKDLGHEDIWNSIICVCPRCHRLLHRYYDRKRKP